MRRARGVAVTVLLLSALAGYQSAAEHRRDVEDTSGRQMTVGNVQREIRVGMSGAEVAQVLGSPNVVTTDERRREVWINDKISTTSACSEDSGGIGALILGGGTTGNGFVGVPVITTTPPAPGRPRPQRRHSRSSSSSIRRHRPGLRLPHVALLDGG